MGWDYISETLATNGPILSIPQMSECGMIWMEKLKDWEKKLAQCCFVYHRSHIDYLGMNVGLHDEKLMSDYLSYNVACIGV
jgi:hypothetical protein